MRRSVVIAAVAGIALVFPGTAIAHTDPLERFHAREQQKLSSGPPGQLVVDNFEVVGHSNLIGGAPHGDVWFHDHGGSVGQHAYVGTWGSPCTGMGAKIVDVNDPAMPKVVGTAGRQRGSSFEDIVVRRIGERDVLAAGLQTCGPGGVGGLALFDVTDPQRPVQLSFLPVPEGGVHELDMMARADGSALAVLAVSERGTMFDPSDQDTIPPPLRATALGRTGSWPPKLAEPVTVDAFGLTDRGKVREDNQDHFYLGQIGRFSNILATSLPDGELPQRHEQANYVAIVADAFAGVLSALRNGRGPANR